MKINKKILILLSVFLFAIFWVYSFLSSALVSKKQRIIKVPISTKTDQTEKYTEDYANINDMYNGKDNILRCTNDKVIPKEYGKEVDGHISFNNDIYDLVRSSTQNNSVNSGHEYVLKKNNQEIYKLVLDDSSPLGHWYKPYLIQKSPVFVFNKYLGTIKESDGSIVTNNSMVLYYKGEDYTQKYNLLHSDALFEYNGKSGFIGWDTNGTCIFYNDKKQKLKFDNILNHSCCMNISQPVQICTNGILSMLVKDNKYYDGFLVVEVDLNNM